MHTRWLLGWLGLCGLLLTQAGCTKGENPWPSAEGPKVLASFPPMYCFAKNVAGEDAVVVSLLTSTGPHGFEATAKDISMVAYADLFLINGLGLDDVSAKKLVESSGSAAKLIVLADGLDKMTLHTDEDGHHHHGEDGDHHHGEAEHEHDEDGHHHHDEELSYDPHVWLGIAEAKGMVKAVEKALAEHDPEHAEAYQKRADAYLQRLDELQAYGRKLFKDKQERKIVTFHDSMRYFADSFGLEIAGVVQVAPGVDPNATSMKKLIDLCVKENVRVVALEPQYPKNSALAVQEALEANGVNDVELIVLDPLETSGSTTLTPEFYETKMRENLENLARALR